MKTFIGCFLYQVTTSSLECWKDMLKFDNLFCYNLWYPVSLKKMYNTIICVSSLVHWWFTQWGGGSCNPQKPLWVFYWVTLSVTLTVKNIVFMALLYASHSNEMCCNSTKTWCQIYGTKGIKLLYFTVFCIHVYGWYKFPLFCRKRRSFDTAEWFQGQRRTCGSERFKWLHKLRQALDTLSLIHI